VKKSGKSLEDLKTQKLKNSKNSKTQKLKNSNFGHCNLKHFKIETIDRLNSKLRHTLYPLVVVLVSAGKIGLEVSCVAFLVFGIFSSCSEFSSLTFGNTKKASKAFYRYQY
jgi:hypothetical protein